MGVVVNLAEYRKKRDFQLWLACHALHTRLPGQSFEARAAELKAYLEALEARRRRRA